MNLSIQKKIAAKIMKCGESRVWMSPAAQEKIKQAITRRDVRGLIKDGLVKKMPAKSGRGMGVKIRMAQRAKGRRSGPGSRKGAKGAREGKKSRWLRIVRPQRNLLKTLKQEGKLQKEGAEDFNYGKLYKQVKGGMFRSKRHLISHLEEHKIAKVSLAEFEAAEKARKAALKHYVIKLPAAGKVKSEEAKKEEAKGK